ncbi:hypothetical protein X798_04124 [Onchocerca flexuosa]|uniref:Phosphoinositide phospholipase C n=1 Tax=Onchocerca flexuosa TaxID=387005 RepID=A0A238BUE2_9BILA|nr:hypothetical protein X798_04124 [Onchocerca flexuosa]
MTSFSPVIAVFVNGLMWITYFVKNLEARKRRTSNKGIISEISAKCLQHRLKKVCIGYQVNSKSSVEMYRYVLLSGCRSIELDCWDGSGGEPIITHGPSQLTRVTPVLFKDVIIAIAETAFLISEFPVILSLENHCSVKQQKKIALYCREIFGNLLLTEPLSNYPHRHRHHRVSWKAISVKVKTAKEAGSKLTDELVARELSDLVNYMRAMGKFTSFADCESRQMSSELFSMNESRAYELVKQNPIEFVNHNKRQITRVYPKGKRVDSSNFWPIKFWNCGCQMTAINMQTPDIPFQMNAAFFEQNGRSGYVPKPSLMRKADAKFNPFETHTMDLVVPAYLSVTIISAQMLSFACEKRPSTYAEVNFYGHFNDLSRFSKRKYRTRIVMDNGINPIYMNFCEESFKFEKIIFPAMASIRLAVYEDNGRLIGHCFLHVRSIQPGFRHIPLRNAHSRPLGPVSLFVLFLVHDYIDDGSVNLVNALQNPIEAMKKIMESEEAASAALINPIDTMKQREKMLLALEESEPQSLSAESALWDIQRSEEGKEFSRMTQVRKKLKERFYLDDMEIRFLSEDELASSQKVVKLEKIFKKKHQSILDLLDVSSKQKVPSAMNSVPEDAFAIYAKYEKERTELIILLVEQNRKKLIKRLDMAYKCESKQLIRLNHQKRYEEQWNVAGTDGTEELRRKYVKLGVEEQRRLNKSKERRLKEINENCELLKRDIRIRMEQRLKKTASVLHDS